MDWKKRLKLYAICLLFVVGSIFMLNSDTPGTMRHPLWMRHIASYIGIFFFGSCGLMAAYSDIRLCLHHQKFIEFSEQGLSIKAGKVIPWSQIKGFAIENVSGAIIILIFTKNPKKEIAKETSWLKRKVMQFNLKTTGSIYSFSTMAMKGSPEDVLLQCEQELAKRRQK